MSDTNLATDGQPYLDSLRRDLIAAQSPTHRRDHPNREAEVRAEIERVEASLAAEAEADESDR